MMKSFAILLLCVVAAVQGRSAGVKTSNRALAALGENPWVVHLRIAVSTSGLLETCAGSLIAESWILTSAACVNNARFIWARYGTVEVIKPELVTESSAVTSHPLWSPASNANNIALIAVNRIIENSQNIAVIPLATAEGDGAAANFCGFGELDDGTPGDYLSCADVEILAVSPDTILVSGDLAASRYDTGAALVKDGVQVGIYSHEAQEGYEFTLVVSFLPWLTAQTGIDFSRAAAPSAPESIIVVDN